MNARYFAPFLLAFSVAFVASAVSGQPAVPSYPPGAGLDLINERCAFCHATAQVLGVRKTPADWATVVRLMIDRGAELDADEQQIVVAYLAENFSSDTASHHAAN